MCGISMGISWFVWMRVVVDMVEICVIIWLVSVVWSFSLMLLVISVVGMCCFMIWFVIFIY